MGFVTFKLARKLKDLGYNVPFFFFYRTDDQLIHHAVVDQPLVYGKYVDNEVVISPTIEQVLNWLRKEKYIFIGISPMQEYGGEVVTNGQIFIDMSGAYIALKTDIGYTWDSIEKYKYWKFKQ